MCTLGIILGESGRYPAIVAANRDESANRPSSPPHLWKDRAPAMVAGRDEVAGGTWLGVNEHGLAVGLTNLWQERPPDATLASRGTVVLGLLAARGLDEARRWLSGRDPRSTNAFLCVVVDGNGRGFFAHCEDGLTPHDIPAGIHAFGNRPPRERPAKLDAAQLRMREAWRGRRGDEPSQILDALRPALAHHTGERRPQESVCVHGGEGFGTVSSSLFLLGAVGERSHLFHAEGKPCETEFGDLGAELDALFAAGRR